MPTKIQWTDETWNPIVGCSKVSEGCRNCYAERMAKRLKAMGQPQYDRVVDEYGWTGIAELVGDAMIMKPSTWKHPRKVFVCSMSDLFGESVSDSAIDTVMVAIQTYKHHTYQLLTKRPERMAAYFSSHPVPENVWLGVTVENQEQFDKRFPWLLHIDTFIRFVSIEPMLGAIDMTRWGRESDIPNMSLEEEMTREYSPIEFISWAICGGETGPGARPTHPDWVRNLRDQCVNAEVPFFFKGWGYWAPDCLCDSKEPHTTIDRPQPGLIGCMFHCGKKAAGRELDGQVWEQFPEV